MNYKLPKSSFLNSKEYTLLLKSQKKLHSPYFILIYQKHDSPENKLGYSLSKKNIPLAVKRNLYRRLIKESFRKSQQLFSGKRVLIIVKKSISEAKKSEINQCLEIFWKKLAAL